MTTVTLMACRWSGVFVVVLIIAALLTVACSELEVPTAPTETVEGVGVLGLPGVPVPVEETRIIGLSGTMAFGNVTVGTSTTTTLTISNNGNRLLTWSGLSTGNGVFTASATSGTVAAGGSATVRLTFTPSAVTSYSSTLTVTSDATSGTNTTTVSGTGTAPTPTCSYSVTPSVLEIGSTSSDNKGTLRVTTTSSCSWSVLSLEYWVTANPTSGTGNGSITITGSASGLSSLPGSERSANIRIGNMGSAVTASRLHQRRSASTTATFEGTIDSNCTGIAVNVTVFVDGSPIGTAQPGGSVTKTVSIGYHVLSARSSNGWTWSEATRFITSAGYRYNFYCI